MPVSACIACQQTVRPRQEGLQCGGCFRWQHRTCGTGVSQSDYRTAVKNSDSIDWRCSACEPVPLAESTPVLFDNFDSTVYDPPISDQSDLPVFDLSSISQPVNYQSVDDPALDESSIAEPSAREDDTPFAVTFQIVSDSTSKGKPKLIDSRGYSYGVKRHRANATDWVCTIRPKVNIILLASKIIIHVFKIKTRTKCLFFSLPGQPM